MNKYYDEGGNLDKDAIQNKLASYGGMEYEQKYSALKFAGGNSSPQELYKSI